MIYLRFKYEQILKHKSNIIKFNTTGITGVIPWWGNCKPKLTAPSADGILLIGPNASNVFDCIGPY
jgi:hypothetical protein